MCPLLQRDLASQDLESAFPCMSFHPDGLIVAGGTEEAGRPGVCTKSGLCRNLPRL